MVRVAAVVRDQKGRFVQDLTVTRFRGPRRRQSQHDRRFSAATSPASASRCCSTSAAAWKASCRTRARPRRTFSAGSTRRATRRRSSPSTRISTSARRSRPGCKTLPDVDGRRSCRSARRRCTTRSPRPRRRVGEREGRRRAVVVLTDGADNASRLTPAEVSAIASAIDVPVYIFGIVPSIDNPAEDTRRNVGRAVGVRRSAGRSGRLDRRARVRGEHAGTAQHRGAANHRRAAASVSDRVRIERQAGLASARGPCAEQGPDRPSPERVHRGAITPDVVLGGSIMLRKFFVAVPIAVLGDRRLDGVRHQEVRPHERRRSEREGRLAGPLHRGDAGADAQERRAHLRGRSEGRRPRRSRREQANDAGGGGEHAAAAANAVGTEANAKFDTIDKASKRLVYEVVLSEDQGNFKFGKTSCPTKRSRRSTRWSRS